jgi:hypothetical protein
LKDAIETEACFRGAGGKGEMLEEKVDLVAIKATKANHFKALLTIVGVQCKVKR